MLFDRGKELEVIKRYSYCVGSSFKLYLDLDAYCCLMVLNELILELGYHRELSIEYLNMFLFAHNSDSCVTLKVLNSEGATSDRSKLFEKSAQKGENIRVFSND